MDFAQMMYGTAQNAEQNVGQGVQQSMAQGADLALRKQQLDTQQQYLQMQMQHLQTAKVQKFYDFVGNAKNIQNAADRKNYLKLAEGYGNTMGINVSNGALQGLASDEMQQRLYTLETSVKAGQRTAQDAIDLATNPMRADELSKVPLTPLEFMNKPVDLGQSQEFAINKEQQLKIERERTQEMLAAAQIRANAQTGNVDKVSGDFQKTAAAQLAPINKEQAALSGALDARDRILTSLQKDPSGRLASPQDIGAMVYTLLHSELGRVNTTELENQLHIPGLSQGWTQDQIVKAMGGVNPNVVRGLVARLDSAASATDAAAQQKAASLKGALSLKKHISPEDQDAIYQKIVGPLVKPVSRPAPGAATVTVNGMAYPRATLQAYVANPANAQHPDYAAAKAALLGPQPAQPPPTGSQQ